MRTISNEEYVQFISTWSKEKRIYKIHLHDENKRYLASFRLDSNYFIVKVFEELSKPIGYSSVFLKKHFAGHFCKLYHFDGLNSYRHISDDGVIETAFYV